MTKSSTLDSFRSKGGTLSFVTDNWSPKTLTVNTLHASSMNIAMGVSTADNTGDRIDILNKATGDITHWTCPPCLTRLSH
nr:hypothetical protein [Escherichia coli]